MGQIQVCQPPKLRSVGHFLSLSVSCAEWPMPPQRRLRDSSCMCPSYSPDMKSTFQKPNASLLLPQNQYITNNVITFLLVIQPINFRLILDSSPLLHLHFQSIKLFSFFFIVISFSVLCSLSTQCYCWNFISCSIISHMHSDNSILDNIYLDQGFSISELSTLQAKYLLVMWQCPAGMDGVILCIVS